MKYYKKDNKATYCLKNEISNYPEIDSTSLVEITEEEWIELTKIPELTKAQKNQISYKTEMNEIIAWLNSHDYIVNKHALGEYADNDERWTKYLSDRATKLARYNELEGKIK